MNVIDDVIIYFIRCHTSILCGNCMSNRLSFRVFSSVLIIQFKAITARMLFADF